jgi:uncharacterized protein (TIGR02145 family)
MNMNTCIKFFALCAILLCNCLTIVGQSSIKLGSNPFTKNKNAAFEIESTNQGLMLPRLTTAQRDAITKPTTGLMIWCTDCGGTSLVTPNGTGQINIYNTSTNPAAWVSMSVSSLSVPTLTSSNDPITDFGTGTFTFKSGISNNGYNDNDYTTHINTITNSGIGCYYKEYTDINTTIPSDSDTSVASSTVFTASTQPLAVFKTNFTSMSTTKSYYIIPFARNAKGVGYGNPFIYSLAVPTFTNLAIDVSTTQQSIISTDMSLLAGVPFNSATFSYGSSTSSMTTVNADLTPAVTGIDTKTAGTTTTLIAKIPVTTNGMIYGTFNIKTQGNTINGLASIVTTKSFSFTPTVESTSKGSAVVVTIAPQTPPSGIKVGTAVSAGTIWYFDVTASTAGTCNISFSSNGLTFASPTIPVTLVANVVTSIPVTITGTALQYGTMTITSDLYTSLPVATSSLTIGFVSQTAAGTANCDATHGTSIVPVISSSGATWMDRNLGAFNAAISLTDYGAYGCLFQWGRGNDGHANVTYTSATVAASGSATTTTLATTVTPGANFIITNGSSWANTSTSTSSLWQPVTVADGGLNNPCPISYRVPTETELFAEFNSTNSALKYTAVNVTAAFNNLTTTTLMGLRTVVSGLRKAADGTFAEQGTYGSYWVSNNSTVINNGKMMYLNGSIFSNINSAPKSYCYAVRCIKIK